MQEVGPGFQTSKAVWISEDRFLCQRQKAWQTDTEAWLSRCSKFFLLLCDREQSIDFAAQRCLCERNSQEAHGLTTELTFLPPEPGVLFKFPFLNGLLQLCSLPPSFLTASLISASVEDIVLGIQTPCEIINVLSICSCTGVLQSHLLTLPHLSTPEWAQSSFLPKLSYSGTL